MICVFCGQPLMQVKYDRKGRPYLACAGCGTKVFTRGMETVAMYGVVAEAIRSLDWAAVRAAAGLRVASIMAGQPAGQPVGEKIDEPSRASVRAGG